jgi:hypothetical protein
VPKLNQCCCIDQLALAGIAMFDGTKLAEMPNWLQISVLGQCQSGHSGYNVVGQVS